MTESSSSARRGLLVFADDWGRHPSSCQHLIRCLLDRYEVFWVNTIGMRKPRLDVATLRRGWGKLRQWLSAASRGDDQPANLHVLNPRMWPWLSTRFDRWLNRELLRQQLTPYLRSLPTPPVAVTTLPIVADLVGQLPVHHWVYYCVDDFGQWPGLDQTCLQKMEAKLLAKVDRVIAVSEPLQKRLAHAGCRAPLLTHGVDLDFWAIPQDVATSPGLEGVQHPWIIFWGLVDGRMDLAFIKQLAEDLREGSIVLMGPEAEGGRALRALPRVRCLPPVPFAQLPDIARRAAVLVMPYADLPVTHAIQPLKLKEYLATGRPVVARDLPATRPWGDCLDLVSTPAAFSQAVRRRLSSGLPAQQYHARKRLSQEGWTAKARRFEYWSFDPQAAPVWAPAKSREE